MICARIDTSSEDTGSSSTITLGLEAMARAMASLWRWPPENSWGKLWRSSAPSPTCSSATRERSSRSCALTPAFSNMGSPTKSAICRRGFMEL